MSARGGSALDSTQNWGYWIYPTSSRLPGMDGYQICLHLRREPALQGLTLIAVTGHEWKKDVLRTASDRFERRLTEEMSTVRLEMAAMRVSLLRWMFGFLRPVRFLCLLACIYLIFSISLEVLTTRQMGNAVDHIKDLHAGSTGTR